MIRAEISVGALQSCDSALGVLSNIRELPTEGVHLNDLLLDLVLDLAKLDMQTFALALARAHALSVGLDRFVNPDLDELLQREPVRCPPFQFNIYLLGDHQVGLCEFLFVLVQLFCQLGDVSTGELVS